MSRWVALLICAHALAAAAEPRRIAVLVGANSAAEGRSALRFAHKDAERMAEVLREAGRFAAADIHLLKDPRPSELLAAIDGSLAQLAKESGETLFLFFYSGHSDHSALYPSGEALALEQLRSRLDNRSATVRLGVIDACRGGSWTRAKGLSPDAPFQVDVPFGLSSEGSVLISSSSGAENAHESDALEGSFFTHHLVAGMRGAADRSGDGEVSLTEAFGYAQELTVRDSALQAQVPQHPSFDMNLHGRTDLPLTRAANASSIVSVTQALGPIEVVQLQTGLVVLEMTEGARTMQVALPPGKYVFRRRGPGGVFAREVLVAPNSSVPLDEASLILVGRPELASKGIQAPPSTVSTTTLPARTVEVRMAVGLRQGLHDSTVAILDNPVAVLFGFSWALTDRLQLAPLSVAYRFGERGKTEWVPFVGLSSVGWKVGTDQKLLYTLGGGVGARFWLLDRHAINATAGASSDAFYSMVGFQAPSNWRAQVSVGYSGLFTERVSFNVGINYGQFVLLNGSGPRGVGSAFSAPSIAIGSVQSLGQRQLPLVGVHLTDRLTIEAHGAIVIDPYQTVGANVLLGAALEF